MAIIATDSNRFSSVVKWELSPEQGYCRDVITVNDAVSTLKVGAVLGKFLASPTGVAGATVGTGNGVMGAITVTSNSTIQTGVYTLRIIKAVTNAGDFELMDPTGRVVGIGSVALAFSQGGIAFTLADGAADFVVGDTIPITVAGTVKYKLCEASATDGSQVAAAVYVSNVQGLSQDLLLVLNTDTTVLALARGPVIVAAGALTYGASVTAGALTNAAIAQLKAVGIIAETTN